MEQIPGLREDKCGTDKREVILTFDADMGNTVREACRIDDINDGMCLARASTILRKEMFNDFLSFNGSFSGDFVAKNSVPLLLLNFITMVLERNQIDCANDVMSNDSNVAALSISQLIRFNSVKRARTDRAANVRHSMLRECPLTTVYCNNDSFSNQEDENC